MTNWSIKFDAKSSEKVEKKSGFMKNCSNVRKLKNIYFRTTENKTFLNSFSGSKKITGKKNVSH